MKKLVLSLILVMVFVGCQNQTKENKQMDWGTKEAFNKSQKALEDSISKVETKTEKIITKDSNLLDFTILKEARDGVNVLIAPHSNKEKIRKLVLNLFEQYRKFQKDKGLDDWVVIKVYDSKEAWEKQDDNTYPEEKYYSHFIVSMTNGKEPGYRQKGHFFDSLHMVWWSWNSLTNESEEKIEKYPFSLGNK
jgi:hypothetical protein